MTPTKETQEFLRRQFWGYYRLYSHIKEFKVNQLGAFTVILYDGRIIPGFEFNIFRGRSDKFTEYLNTFKR